MLNFRIIWYLKNKNKMLGYYTFDILQPLRYCSNFYQVNSLSGCVAIAWKSTMSVTKPLEQARHVACVHLFSILTLLESESRVCEKPVSTQPYFVQNAGNHLHGLNYFLIIRDPHFLWIILKLRGNFFQWYRMFYLEKNP